MRGWVVLLLFVPLCSSRAQAPFVTDQDRMFVFSEGSFEKLEPRPPRRIFPMKGSVAYEDHAGALRIFIAGGRHLYQLASRPAVVKASDQRIAWISGDTLWTFGPSGSRILSVDVDSCDIAADLIVWQDREGLKVLPPDALGTILLCPQPQWWKIGGNGVMFADSARVVLFQQGAQHHVAADTASSIAIGRDIAAYWVVGQGLVVHDRAGARVVSAMRPVELQAGDRMVAFIDPHQGLKCFVDDSLHIVLDRSPTAFWLVDEHLLFLADGALHSFTSHGLLEVGGFVPEWWQVNGDLLAYLDLDRRLHAIQKGERRRLGKDAAITDPHLFPDGKILYTTAAGRRTVVANGRSHVL